MSLFSAVAIAVVSASLVGYLLRLFRQPLIIGYIFAGILLSYFGVFTSEHKSALETMSQLGITLLLFLVGLEMNLKELPTVGKAAIITGLGQIIFTLIFGFVLASLLGFSQISALYIAVALSFSSTVIIVKLLSEKHDIGSLYGKISVGFLLVQDVVAILILMFLSGFQAGDLSVYSIITVLLKGVVLIGGIILISKYLLQKIFYKVAYQSSDLLFISSIGWALLVASFSSLPQIGFSIEIGGFLAGIALANSAENLQIASRVRPLRDFFITIFFLVLGTKMIIGITPSLILPAIILSVVVLIGNPLIVLSLMGLLGFKKRTSFLASVTVAQISEFSFILVALGEKIGHINQSIVGLITIVGVVTMTISTYLILNGNSLYLWLRRLLDYFEREKVHEKGLEINRGFSGHTLLFGCDRLGRRLLPTLEKKGEVVVIDFNPKVIENLVAQNHTAFYGDVSDIEYLDALNLCEARLVVSTTGSFEDDLIILEYLAKASQKPMLIFTSSNSFEALQLYEKGADYVIVPQIAAGDHLAHLLSVHGINKSHFKLLRERHFDRLAKDRYLQNG